MRRFSFSKMREIVFNEKYRVYLPGNLKYIFPVKQYYQSFQFHHFRSSGSYSSFSAKYTAHLKQYNTHLSICAFLILQRLLYNFSGFFPFRSDTHFMPRSIRSSFMLGPIPGIHSRSVLSFGFFIEALRPHPLIFYFSTAYSLQRLFVNAFISQHYKKCEINSII
jgi:hypothetical protein